MRRATVPENKSVKIEAEELAHIHLDQVHRNVANDGARSSLTVFSTDRLLALDPGLNVIGEWPTGPVADSAGWHATDPKRKLALVSDDAEVRMIDQRGRAVWRHQHDPWHGQSGCAWFDESGEPYAITPEPLSGGCRVVRLDLQTGQPRAHKPVYAAPDAVTPVHHRDGWVGLTTEEKWEEGNRAWWVRSHAKPSADFDVIEAGWNGWYLTDVDRSGTRILTTSVDEPILVRSFPGLDVIRTIEPPAEDHQWGSACFADDLIITTVSDLRTGDETRGAIDPAGTFHPMDSHGELEWLSPAADGTWLIATPTSIRRYRATRK
jgi:hypothetical protein